MRRLAIALTEGPATAAYGAGGRREGEMSYPTLLISESRDKLLARAFGVRCRGG